MQCALCRDDGGAQKWLPHFVEVDEVERRRQSEFVKSRCTVGHRLHVDCRLRVAVADCGPGIAEEFHSRIFGKFAQADSSDTRQKGGTGLGLSIAKALVERELTHLRRHGHKLPERVEVGTMVEVPSLLYQLRVDRDERRGERPLSQEVLEHVWHAERRAPRVGERRGAEVMSEEALPDEPRDPAEQDAGRDQARGARALRSFGHRWKDGVRSRRNDR